MVQTQFQSKIQILQTGNAKEYFLTNLESYLSTQGIIHQSSCIEPPQQNGIAERKNHHLLEVARSLTFTANVPKHFSGEAVFTTNYLINWIPLVPFNLTLQVNYFSSHFLTLVLSLPFRPKYLGVQLLSIFIPYIAAHLTPNHSNMFSWGTLLIKRDTSAILL